MRNLEAESQRRIFILKCNKRKLKVVILIFSFAAVIKIFFFTRKMIDKNSSKNVLFLDYIFFLFFEHLSCPAFTLHTES